ncbi:hypothetical protein EXIGLDRAFT_694167, partial [Exidia glandulosa HHB12029]
SRAKRKHFSPNGNCGPRVRFGSGLPVRAKRLLRGMHSRSQLAVLSSGESQGRRPIEPRLSVSNSRHGELRHIRRALQRRRHRGNSKHADYGDEANMFADYEARIRRILDPKAEQSSTRRPQSTLQDASLSSGHSQATERRDPQPSGKEEEQSSAGAHSCIAYRPTSKIFCQYFIVEKKDRCSARRSSRAQLYETTRERHPAEERRSENSHVRKAQNESIAQVGSASLASRQSSPVAQRNAIKAIASQFLKQVGEAQVVVKGKEERQF